MLPPPADRAGTASCGCGDPSPCGPVVTPPPEVLLDRFVEESVQRAVFAGNEPARRHFLKALGAAGLTELIGSVFPLDAAKALAQDTEKKPEKKKLTVGFIPITCATPIIMAEPMGFYKKHGLEATVKRASGWAVIRDWAVNGTVDAAHMLSPMPLAISLGAGSKATPFYTAAIENINGQAITLAKKHKGVKTAADMKGFRFCVPFPYSMHNYLLRYFLAEGGLDPDKDVEIRVIPPPEMVANLKAGNVDGYLAPDPFNQRAVYDGAGFIFKLSKELWDGHPCCAFAVSEEFAKENPNTFLALMKSILEATKYASDPKNRKEIAKEIAPANYLNQPRIVLEQVLLGRYADGLGKVKSDAKRIDFDPYPWHSMAVWILTQMQRWKQIKGDVDYKKVAEKVFRAADCDAVAKALGHATHKSTYAKHTIMGKEFDADKAKEYLEGFKIKS